MKLWDYLITALRSSECLIILCLHEQFHIWRISLRSEEKFKELYGEHLLPTFLPTTERPHTLSAFDSLSISPGSPHDGTEANVASHVGLEHEIDGRKPSSAGALRSRKDAERNRSSHRGSVGNPVDTFHTLTAAAAPIASQSSSLKGNQRLSHQVYGETDLDFHEIEVTVDKCGSFHGRNNR